MKEKTERNSPEDLLLLAFVWLFPVAHHFDSSCTFSSFQHFSWWCGQLCKIICQFNKTCIDKTFHFFFYCLEHRINSILRLFLTWTWMVKMLIMQVCSKEYIDFFLFRNSLIPMAFALDVLKNIIGIIICYNGYCLKSSHQRLKTSFSPFSSIFGISYLRK